MHRHLEEKPVEEITKLINGEDKKVAIAIEEALPQLNRLIIKIVDQLKNGGRMFYLGAGSGGRLSVLDAIELPTTYGVPKGMVNVILAGGINRLAEAPEEKEDEEMEGWYALLEHQVSKKRYCNRYYCQRNNSICAWRVEGMQNKPGANRLYSQQSIITCCGFS